MPALFPLLQEADAFRPVGVAGQPIFRWDCTGYAMFYAPGYLCVVGLPDADRFQAGLQTSEGQAAELRRHAKLAKAEASRWREPAFRPECLTLYMNNECNLRCVYCYTDPSPQPVARLGLDAIVAAGKLVAHNCRDKGRPFYTVYHGGGEPTLHRERVESAQAALEAVAAACAVKPVRYVATNGVMSEEKAVWLARHFDLIGLSCDGPADIQNSQRPFWDGSRTSQILERTAHILREEGCRLHGRTTITPASLRRQAEIADYVCQLIAPEEIHFEPVYLGGRTSQAVGLEAGHAGEFVAHFLQARQVAQQHGIRLTSSGARPGSLHGPYCHVFRDTLNLVPGDVATACFKVTDLAHVEETGVVIGVMNHQAGRFEIDHARVQDLSRQLGVMPAECAGCFNRYHCVRECPDRCPLNGTTGKTGSEPGFRCHTHKALAYAMLKEIATRMAPYDDFAWFYNRYWSEEFHSVAFPLLERICLASVAPGAGACCA